MQKILLYYSFVPIKDPEAVVLWQRSVAQHHGLRGRILISPHGINGTLGGSISGLKAYVSQTKAYRPFKHMEFKWSEGGAEHFPKLSVKVRPEIVSFGAADELIVDETGIVGGGIRLTPQEVHELVAKRGDEVVFFDGRNKHEAAVGRFKNAIIPNVEATRDFITELNSERYDAIKDKPVITYCTGGIRCEVLSSLMKQRGFKEVYQIDGGIVRYGETYGDSGLWEGSLYVFDGRKDTTFSDQSRAIAACQFCDHATSNYENCEFAACNALMLVCSDCAGAQTACLDCRTLQQPAAHSRIPSH
jgi:UPF0176 protein